MTKGKKAFPLQHDGVGKQKSTETKIVIKKYSIDSSYSAEGGKSIPNQTKVAPKKASPKNRIKKEDSLFTEPTLDSINVDCPVKLNKILPQSTITCRHIPAQGQLLRMYHAVARAIHWSQETRKFSSNCRDCSISPLNSWSPIYACLQCVNFSCLQISFSPSIHSKTTEAPSNHFHNHMTETGHALGIHITSGVLHCASCNVTLWDDQLENIWNFSKKTSSLSCPFINRLQAVEETIGYAPSKNSLFVKICPGIRGLYNLGNTCYMNSTLQILLNSPLLKRFFLSPSYPPHPNVPTAAGVNKRLAKCPLSHAPSSNTRNNHECIACEFDSLLVEMNSIYGDTQKMAKAPISPHRLLTALWKASPNEFAGYAQRDAHEFLVALRSIFHTHCGGTAFNCKCIVHTLFSGVLKSDITCLECGGVAETLDPFLDLSLDIPSKSSMLGTLNMYSMSSSMSENSPFDDSKKNKIVSLENCLEKFTRQERLQSDGYTCRICRSTQQEILKRLSLPAASLPSILTIQIKRFKHLSNTTASSLKIDTPVSFPLVLDMSPYTGSFSSAISHAGLQDIEFDVSKNHQDEQRRRKYHLYGLICHIGSLDSGHYTAYIRKSEMSWFLIDDASVTLVSWEIVQSLPTAYMLFYTV